MAKKHSSPHPIGLGPTATVRAMAKAAASLYSSVPDRKDQFDATVETVGGFILDGLPAHYHATDGALTPLTRDHHWWLEMVAYLRGERTRTESIHEPCWVTGGTRTSTQRRSINQAWIDQVIIKKKDYHDYRRARNEPRPEWWPEGADAPKGWPWGSHETELLRKLAKVANKFWTLYDPSDPSTAPTNEEVEAWLMKNQGVPQRLAEAMAQILRADGLPRGPRK